MPVAVAAFLLVVGPATAATHATRGVVVANRARAGTIILSGAKGVGITVHVSSQRVRLGDRVSVVGKRVRVLSHVKRAMIRGVVVKDIPSDDSPAKAAGIEPGDIIVAVDGKPVEYVGQLQQIIETHKAGDKVTLTILRGGQKKKVEVELVDRSK